MEIKCPATAKVRTEKGKRNNRTLSLRFELPYTTVEVARLEVIKPSGEVVQVDLAADSKETIDNRQMQMNIFDPRMRVLREKMECRSQRQPAYGK